MSLLTFDNPVFRYYAIAAALIVKMMSQRADTKRDAVGNLFYEYTA